MAGPGGVEVGRANVRVLPDTTKFAPALKKFLDRMERTHRLDIKLGIDDKGFAAEVKSAVASARNAAGDIDVAMDLDPAALASDAKRAASAAEDAVGKIDVPMDVDASGLARDVRNASNRAEHAAKDIQVKLNLQNVAAFVARSAAVVKAAGAGLSMRVRMTLDSKPFLAAVAAMKVGMNFFGADLLNMIRTLPQFVGMISVATVAIAGMAGPLAAAAAAAGQAVSAFATLGAAMAPGLFVGAGLAVGALAVSFKGLGAAINAASPEELADALAELPESAQQGALAIRGLKEEFQGMGDQIQDGFWSQLQNLGDLQPLIAPIGDAVTKVAAAMGAAASSTVDFLSSATGMEAFQALLDSGANAAGRLASVILDWIPGFVAVGAAAGPVLDELTSGINDAAQAWSDKMVKGFEDGSLTAHFEELVEKTQSFRDTMSEMGGIVSGVWNAMTAAGQPFLGTIGQAIEKTNEWVNSVQGQTALTDFFTSMSESVGAVLPIIGQLAAIIGTTLAPAISDLLTNAAPGLSALVDGLGQGLAAMAPAMGQVGTALGELGAAMGPVLEALGPVLGAAISGIATAISTLAGMISAATPAITSILEALTPIAPVIAVVGVAMMALAPVLSAVSSAFAALAPILNIVRMVLPLLSGPMLLLVAAVGMLVAALMQNQPAMDALKEAFSQIMVAIAPLIEAIFQLVGTIISALMPVFQALVPVVVAVVQVFASIVTAIAPIITVVVQVITVFAQLLATIISFVASALGMILSFVAAVISGFVSMGAGAVGAVSGFVSSVIGFFANLASSAISKATSMWSSVVSAFSSGVSSAVSFVGQLPGMAVSALGDLGSLLVNSGKALIQGFINGIKSMIGAAVDAAKSAVSAVRDFFPFSPAKKGPFSGHGWVLHSGRAIGEAFAQGISDRAGLAPAAAMGIMSATASNLRGYKADGAGSGGDGSGGPAADYSVNIGTIVAADEKKPIRDAEQLQLKAKIKGGMA